MKKSINIFIFCLECKGKKRLSFLGLKIYIYIAKHWPKKIYKYFSEH